MSSFVVYRHDWAGFNFNQSGRIIKSNYCTRQKISHTLRVLEGEVFIIFIT